jgi:hypothetical protein
VFVRRARVLPGPRPATRNPASIRQTPMFVLINFVQLVFSLEGAGASYLES